MGTLMLIDGANLLRRCYHGASELTNREGVAVELVQSLVRSMRRAYSTHKPHFWLWCEDSPGGWRRALYPQYKANRGPLEERYTAQLTDAYALLDRLGVSRVCVEGMEADDLIASASRTAFADPAYVDRIVIMSLDKDLMQLVDDKRPIVQWDGQRDLIYREAEVRLKWEGCAGKQIRGLLALAGDSADNIPGVAGVGVKTAAAILKAAGGMAGLRGWASEAKGKRAAAVCEAVEDGTLDLWWSLVGLKSDLDLPLTLADCVVRKPDYAALLELYRRLYLRREAEKLQSLMQARAHRPVSAQVSLLAKA